MLREWISALSLLLVLVGGTLGWYADDRAGAFTADGLQCGADDTQAPFLQLRVFSPSPLAPRRNADFEVVVVNPTQDDIEVVPSGYNVTVYRVRWDGLLAPVASVEGFPPEHFGDEPQRVPPGAEQWVGFSTFDVWSEVPDAGGAEYRLAARAYGLCATAEFSTARA